MNTHLDHLGVRAREESAKLLLTLADKWSRQDGESGLLPVFLAGDFNSPPGDGAYQNILGGMTDISDIVPKPQRYGHDEITYTSFGEPEETAKRIDFLFVKDPERLRFISFGILENRFDDAVFLSDHRAVVTDMEIPA